MAGSLSMAMMMRGSGVVGRDDVSMEYGGATYGAGVRWGCMYGERGTGCVRAGGERRVIIEFEVES